MIKNKVKIIFSAILGTMLCYGYASANSSTPQTAVYGDIKKPPPAKVKLGIKSTQTEFGAMAVADQAKRIEVVNLEDGCSFSQSFIKVDFKEPVRFVLKNQNDFAIKLMFTELDKNPAQANQNGPYKIAPVKIQKKQYHAFKMAENGRHVFNWFFNRKKYFRWVCVNHNDEILGSADIQVGNASKLSRKERKEIKLQNKFKSLPPPPVGF